MWQATVHATPGARVRRYVLNQDGAAARWAEVILRWREDAGFRSFFTGLLADAPFDAFRWETPALSGAAVSLVFEFVLVDDPALDRPADPQAFADQFPPDAPPVATFPNLGGDAVLVVPRPAGQPTAYAHLAAFVRGAPDGQRHALWRAVATAVESRLGPRPLWLSTAGAGVAWLHVRLDTRPKYYAHRPYATAARAE